MGQRWQARGGGRPLETPMLPPPPPLPAVVIYYGSAPNFSCRLCRAVYAASGPKWRLAHRFTLLPEWAAYKQRYQAIMLPDDDLVVSGWVGVVLGIPPASP